MKSGSKYALALEFLASRAAQGATTIEIAEHAGMRQRSVASALGRLVHAGYLKKSLAHHRGNQSGVNHYTRTDKPMPEKKVLLCAAIIDGESCGKPARPGCRTCCAEHGKLRQLCGHKRKTCKVLVDGKPCGKTALPKRRCCSDEHARLGSAHSRADILHRRRVKAIEAADARVAAARKPKSPKPPRPTKASRTAQETARQLMQFWHSQGFTDVKFWVEPAEHVEGFAVELVVKSNLQNGLAPSQVGKAA